MNLLHIVSAFVLAMSSCCLPLPTEIRTALPSGPPHPSSPNISSPTPSSSLSSLSSSSSSVSAASSSGILPLSSSSLSSSLQDTAATGALTSTDPESDVRTTRRHRRRHSKHRHSKGTRRSPKKRRRRKCRSRRRRKGRGARDSHKSRKCHSRKSKRGRARKRKKTHRGQKQRKRRPGKSRRKSKGSNPAEGKESSQSVDDPTSTARNVSDVALQNYENATFLQTLVSSVSLEAQNGSLDPPIPRPADVAENNLEETFSIRGQTNDEMHAVPTTRRPRISPQTLLQEYLSLQTPARTQHTQNYAHSGTTGVATSERARRRKRRYAGDDGTSLNVFLVVRTGNPQPELVGQSESTKTDTDRRLSWPSPARPVHRQKRGVDDTRYSSSRRRRRLWDLYNNNRLSTRARGKGVSDRSRSRLRQLVRDMYRSREMVSGSSHPRQRSPISLTVVLQRFSSRRPLRSASLS